MADTAKTASMLLDELAALDPPTRREVAKGLSKVSETFAEVPDGKTASHVLGVSPTYSTRSTCTEKVGSGTGFRLADGCVSQRMLSRKYVPIMTVRKYNTAVLIGTLMV